MNAFSSNVCQTETLPWWKNGVVYQIYPKSFQDTTGRGTGDLLGIIKRLDYLHLLGISAIWLTPIYPSPQVDNGYDVADYCAIDANYGSMADFEELVSQAHQRGIKIMMDMVFNHTSNEHPWFKSALDKESPLRSFYIWRDKKEGKEPNNWLSKFGGSAWEWHDESQQYYLHLFAKEQPDLNWENPAVRAEIKKVCQFWSDKGVDALRLDVINLISKPEFVDDPDGDGKPYYSDGPRIHEFLQELSRDALQPNGLVTVGEMSGTRLEHCQRYAALDGRELSMTFNFHHLKVDYAQGEKWSVTTPDFIELKKIFSTWQHGMYNQAWNALFWCNHDQPRIVSRFGDEGKWRQRSAKMLAMVLHGLQGTPYIYQGEEIGMTNAHFTTIEQYRDIECINAYHQKLSEGVSQEEILAALASKSRDNSRTPMQWNCDRHAGFTEGTPWIELNDNYQEINVESALKDPSSIFHTYQTLITLRKRYSIFSYGNFTDLLPNSATIWCYLRQAGDQKLLVIANLTNEPQSFMLPNLEKVDNYQLLLSNHQDHSLILSKDSLQPYECYYFYADDNAVKSIN